MLQNGNVAPTAARAAPIRSGIDQQVRIRRRPTPLYAINVTQV